MTVTVVSPATRVVGIYPTGNPAQTEAHTFSFQGPLHVYTGEGRLYIDLPVDMVSARFTVSQVSPVDTTFDVKVNGVTSLFPTPVTLAANQNTVLFNTGFEVTRLEPSDFLTVDIISTSLTQPAANLTVNIRVRRLS